MAVLLGCIADDLTGATDLADTLVRNGMRTVQLIGIPDETTGTIDADAIVVALKCRSIRVELAVQECVTALQWLRNADCRQFFWKYCSTFDSTEKGNIGPVAEALLKQLESDLTIVCPAFPTNKRTIYKGHLFVGDVPLHESSMRHHPLTPMTDSSLLRILQPQVNGRVGLIPWEVVRQDERAIRKACISLQDQGVRFAVIDAIEDRDLALIGNACAEMPLITGGSGIALGLPENFRRQGLLPFREDAGELPEIPGRSMIFAGSCSEATRRQVAWAKERIPALRLDPLILAEQQAEEVEEAVAWALTNSQDGPALLYSSALPEEVRTIQEKLGREIAGKVVEDAFAHIARRLRDDGVRRFIVAGGETAGAVVKGLGARGLRIGPRIDPGVPWTSTLETAPIALALKSGNFGSTDFFLKALEVLS